MKIIVIGGGSFGTALSNVLANNHEVIILLRDKDIENEINKNNTNSIYFPNIRLNDKLKATTDYEIVKYADIIIFAIPSKIVLDEYEKIRLLLVNNPIIINTAKGFSSNRKTILDELKNSHKNSFSLLGPTFANNLIKNEYSAFTVATDDKNHFALAQILFLGTNIILDYSLNYKLIETASILKNVFAIANGLYDSIDDSVNTKYVFLNQSYKDMMLILNSMFKNEASEDFDKFAVFGDLLLTSLNEQSRNKTLGQLIGRGFYNIKENQSKITFEGIRSTKHMYEYAKEKKLFTPVLEFTNNILLGNNIYKEFTSCMESLKSRELI
jgi:glycerol-3-phosphate dehydrogenase (NAD(P)+)